MPAIVGEATPDTLKSWLGRGAYASERSYSALEVRIANGAYQGGILVAPKAKLEEGSTVIHVLTGSSKWALAREWARVALGIPFKPSPLQMIKVSDVWIDSISAQPVAVVGEVITRTPIQISVARKALLVMCQG
jgi:diacylglycerol kinase family enzyme